jgi:hypothetical protein
VVIAVGGNDRVVPFGHEDNIAVAGEQQLIALRRSPV